VWSVGFSQVKELSESTIKPQKVPPIDETRSGWQLATTGRIH